MIERINEQRRRTRLVRGIDLLTAELERLGETDMDTLQRRFAARFYTATQSLRTLAHDLKREGY